MKEQSNIKKFLVVFILLVVIVTAIVTTCILNNKRKELDDLNSKNEQIETVIDAK